MDCSNNKLTSLDISKNINLGNGSFPGTNDLRGNNLNCICVNSIDDMINRNVFKDSNAVWVEDCSLPCIPPTVTIDNVNFCPGDKDAVLTARSSSAISYKWNFGQSTSSIFINSVGSYSVTVTDSIGLTGTASIEVACNSNGINDFTSSKQFKIYPNPAETTISIGEGNSCKIFSLLGELLITSNFSNVNVENLTTGIYQVIITNNKNQTFSQKLIKE